MRNGNGHRDIARGPRWLQAIIALVGLGVVGVAIAGGTSYGVYRSYANDLLPPDEVIASQPSGGAQILDRKGRVLYEYVDDTSGLRSPVKLEDISPWMIAATISTEDYSYWENSGVNLKGLARAGLERAGLRDADAGTTTGGSSITQQLVKNVYIPLEERSKRSYTRKLKETIYAIELTNNYSKNQILEWYLNQISYGGLYNGVEAAAQGYFGKSAKDLNLPEAAMLAGIPASPLYNEPIGNPENALERRNQVLRIMQGRNSVQAEVDGEKQRATELQVNDDGEMVQITDTMFYLSTVAPVNIVPQKFPVKAPHFVFGPIEKEITARYGEEALYRGGLRVTTTLDLDLQDVAEASLEKWISEYEASADGHNGALVAIDPRTSEVLVMVGSRDYFRDDIQGRNNNATAENSPGSTLKPFTYSAAFERLGWGTETEILDTPISVQDGDELFTPRNPSGNFQGPISVRKALGNSLNIPAFKTALYVGVPNIVSTYKKFGMTTLEEGRPYGGSITLGGVDISLFDVTYAYTVFPNNGVLRGVPTVHEYGEGNRTLDPVMILQITQEPSGKVLYPETEDHRVKVQESRVIDAGHAYLISNVLSDPNAFCITYGCGALTIGRQWAVKTGTSEPYEKSSAIGETWTYGYTPELVAGVWAGNSDNSPMYNILSTSISYRALRDFMVEALRETPPSTFEKPPGAVVEVDTCTPSGMKADKECGRVVKKNLVAKVNEPTKDDDWWQKAKVDIRDGLLATELTPPQFVSERFGFAIPKALQEPKTPADEFALSQARQWASYIRGGYVPTEKSDNRPPVRIDTPDDGQRLRGVVSITGMAVSEGFQAYRLEFKASEAADWTVLLRSETPQPGGGLGLWQTADIAPGTYTLRLVLEDSARGDLVTFVNVTVEEGDRQPTPAPRSERTPKPTATPKRD